MYTTAIATAFALLAGSVLAQDCGYAVVQNKCDYDVHVFNTPAVGGGYSDIYQKISPGGQYTQKWTQLSNAQGWSIKLSPNATLGQNIMQFEYTYHGDPIIWYDLSDVNGNPWNGNWTVSSSNSDSCHPKQQAYCFSTDDAYGMQACPAEAHIIVTLCSADDQEMVNFACNTDAAASTSFVSNQPTSYVSTSAPAPSSYAAPSSSSVESSMTEAASSSVYSTPSQSSPQWVSANTYAAVASSTTSEAPSSASPTSTYVAPTTFATSSTAVISEYGVTVTDIDTAIVTDVVTMTAYGKRHEHHPRHPHNRQA